MIRKVVLIGAFVFGSSALFAQQLGQYSQYIQNPYIINPAAAGVYDRTDINMSMRSQWAGLDYAPKTYYLSGTMVLKTGGSPFFNSPVLRTSDGEPNAMPETPGTGKLKHAVGGLISMDEYGAFKKLTGMLSYALHFPISNKFNMSVGAGIGASNLNFDESMITLENPTDNTYNEFAANTGATTFLDLNMGLWLYSDEFFFGYSSNQLLQNKIYFGSNPTDATLRMHHFITSGYRVAVNENFDVIPSVMLKYMNPAPMSFDITVKAEYQRKYWAAVSYRHTDAVVAMVGAQLNDMFKLGYGYDVTISNLNNYSNGSHEIVLGVLLK